MPSESAARVAVRADSWKRIFVWSFLICFATCGIFGFELWPMTGWRLFADARHQHNVSWTAQVEYRDGTTGNLLLHSAGSSATPFLIGRLAELTPGDSARLCSEWLRLTDAEREVDRIVIYRERRDLGIREGDRGVQPTRDPAYLCDHGKLVEVDR